MKFRKKPVVIEASVDECIQAIVKYRQDEKDFEPNAEWEIDLYKNALEAFRART